MPNQGGFARMEESMTGELGGFDPGYDQRAAFEEAA
jgi:hypothetical protein